MASHPGSSCAEYLPENEQSGAHEAAASAQPTDQLECEYDFVEQPSQDFHCPVTLELLRDPRQTTCCGNHLSQEAAARLQREGKPCPICKEPNLGTVTDKYFKRKVNELLVRCRHKANECKWVGPLSDFDQHCNSCPKRPWVCEYCHFRAIYEVGVNDHLPNCTKYPEPCPNHCDIGTVERCNLENHLRECPLRLVECEFHEAGCSVRVPRRDLGRHMEESGQQHLVAMSLLNLRLTRELHQKMEEKDRQITELREQLDQQGRQLQDQSDETTQEIKREVTGLKEKLQQQGGVTQKQVADIQKQLRQQSEMIQKRISDLQNATSDVQKTLQQQMSDAQKATQQQISDMQQATQVQVSEMQRQLQQQVQKIDTHLPTLWPKYFDFTLTGFSSKKASDYNWFSNPFYTHPQGYKFELNIEPNGQGSPASKGTHVSAYLTLEKGEFDDQLQWPISCTGQLLLLNQLRDHGHHTATIQLRVYRTSSYIYKAISVTFIAHSELGYKAARYTQYLKDDRLHFRLYLGVSPE